MLVSGKGQRLGSGEVSPEDREMFRRQSTELGQRLDALKSQKAKAERSGGGGAQGQSAYGAAFAFAAELIVGVVIGGGLGWFLDRRFSTVPWQMVILVILGFAVGLLNIARVAREVQPRDGSLQKINR